jgi:hypothetical protein
MKEIELCSTKHFGYRVKVDDEDYKELMQYKWYPAHNHRHVKAQRYYTDEDGRNHTEYMHTFLMRPPNGYVTDHIDRNGLNNQRSNLRIVTIAENSRNQEKRLGEYTSKYKGVSRCSKKTPRSKQKWQAVIRYNRKYIYLGRYDTEIEAAKAYNEASLKYHGEYGRLNAFPA